MHDDELFEGRLAVAFGRLAALAPTMDDAAVAREAIAAGSRPRTLVARLSAGIRRPVAGLGPRAGYLVVILALLLAAVLVAVAIGTFRDPSIRLLGRNGTIAFTVQGNNHEAAGSREMGADGSNLRLIAAGRCPTYSRNGNVLASVAYAGTATLEAWDRTGTLTYRRILVEDASTKVSFGLSPDGSSVVWAKPLESGGTELWVAPLAGGPAARLAPESGIPTEVYAEPTWSPDGRQIAFGTFVPDTATGLRIRSSLSLINADGSGLRKISTRPALLDDGISWSPDGRLVAYAGLPDGSQFPEPLAGSGPQAYRARDVFVASIDGSDERNVTETPAFERQPVFSPEGGVLAFQRSGDGLADRVVTVRMNGPTPGGIPSEGPPAAWFVWSPDSTRLAWAVVETIGPETYRSSFLASDPEFKEAPATLGSVDGSIVCTPSWQRLDP
jgi:hypothetical protein